MNHWLIPGVVGNIIVSCVLVGVFYYFYHSEKEKSLLLWAYAWSLLSLRYVCAFFDLLYPSKALGAIALAFAVMASMCLIHGVGVWFKRELNKAVYVLGGIVIVTHIGSIFSSYDQFWFLLMSFTYTGLLFFYTGFLFLKNQKPSSIGARITGIIFIVWGIHKLDYPFLRPLEDFAGPGFMLSSILGLSAALGILIYFFESTRMEVKDGRERLDQILENVNTAIMVHDTGFHNSYYNLKAKQLLGATDADFEARAANSSGWRCRDLDGNPVGEEDFPVSEVMRTKEPIYERYLQYYKESEKRWLWLVINAVPIFSSNGSLKEVVASFSDVTERKNYEMERELLISRLQDKNRELEHFTYTVSHDLKSPLLTIRGFSKLILDEIQISHPDSEILDDARRIITATDKLKSILDDLLELSRAGRFMSVPESINPADVAREASLLCLPAEHNVEIIIHEDMPEVKGDKTRLQQLYQNLISNSVRFTKEQNPPVIEIGSRRDNFQSVFYVKDNGSGIPEDFRDKAFEIFTTLDKHGSGIGLSIVKKIVECHEGKIWIEAPDDGETGAIICFTLKLSEEQV